MRHFGKTAALAILGLGLAGLHLGTAQAHSVYPDAWVSNACSPHDQTASQSGSSFGSCSFWESGCGELGCQYANWKRTISCAKGTTCANVECGTGKELVSATSYYIFDEWAGEPGHGGKSGHFPTGIYGRNCK